MLIRYLLIGIRYIEHFKFFKHKLTKIKIQVIRRIKYYFLSVSSNLKTTRAIIMIRTTGL